MIKNKGGRPPKYPYEFLLKKLTEIALENKMGQLNNSMLSRKTGIPIHVWRDNKSIQEDIKRINSNNLTMSYISDNLVELPNIVDLVEQNFKNKPQLIKHLRSYMDYVDTLYKKAAEYDELLKKYNDLQERYSEAQDKVKILKSENAIYKNEIKMLAVASTSLKQRNELGIPKNILSIDGNKRKASATAKTIEEEFSDLFSI